MSLWAPWPDHIFTNRGDEPAIFDRVLVGWIGVTLMEVTRIGIILMGVIREGGDKLAISFGRVLVNRMRVILMRVTQMGVTREGST